MSNEVPLLRAASSRKELEQDARHRRDKCMSCNEAPEYEVLWAEGMGHAWFCEKHLKEWLKASVASCAKDGFFNKNCKLDSVKKLDNNEASKKFGENKNGNILDSFLSKIAMPRVNKEAKKEKEEEWHKLESWHKQESVGLQDAEELAPVNPSGEKLVKESHGGAKDRKADIKSDVDPFMVAPDETKNRIGALVIHGRGKSVHGDLMFEVSKDWAASWTLYIPKALSKVPSSYKEFVELVEQEIIPVVRKKLETPTLRFLCGKKEPHPAEWLDFKGRVEPGERGATKHEPGFFYIADRFNVEYGAQKQAFHEYFCKDGKLFNGRFGIRLLENKEEWTKTGEGLMTWMAVATKDKTPYVISSRAVTKKWIPGFGHSALPKKLRMKVPEKYKYWRYRGTSKQREVRDELVKELGKTLVKVDSLGPAIYKVFRQTLKIRGGPSRTRYYFAICQDTKGSVKFALATQNNPLENKELAGVLYPEAAALCALEAKVTDVTPKSNLNGTEETPSKIELLERGAASILSNTNFRRFRLRDGKLEGTWIAFQREESSTIWTLKLANPE